MANILTSCFIVSEFFIHCKSDFEATCGSSARLQALVASVPEVLDAARAPSTTALYRGAYQRWVSWTQEFPHVQALPASPQSIILYLVELSNSANSFSPINLAACSIAWGHNMAGLGSPLQHVLVRECLAGLKHKLAKAKQPKEPFLITHIHKFMDIMEKGSLTSVRDTCIIVLSFYGFLRFDEMRHLQYGHVSFQADHVALKIEKCKNDQLREGNVVVIAKLEAPHCPVQLLKEYIAQAQITQPAHYLFRRVILIKGISHLARINRSISYNSVRTLVKAKASLIGLNPGSFATHSMRSGGSSAAANAGVGDRVFQRHGRWASVSAKDGYIKDDSRNRLSVTKALK
jgi:integrase